MKRVMCAAIVLAWAVASSGTQFQRFLSPDRPADRAIMNYMALEQAGKATSMDLTNMAVLILDKGFPTDAEKVLKAALKLDKHNYEASYRLGLVLQRMGRDREAVRYYKLCLEERPGYAQARFMLALAEERCGQRDTAIRDYAKAYRHAPELANAAKNPLIYDSDLQLAAIMKYYQEQVTGMTLKVTVPDPAAVRRMAETPLLAPPQAGQPEAAPPPSVPAPNQAVPKGAPPQAPGGLGIKPAPAPTPRP
jgi:tetratricopeptide (TPR) repeat protein